MGSHREGKKVASGGFPGASHVLKPGFRTSRTEHSTGGCHPHPMMRFLSFLTADRIQQTRAMAPQGCKSLKMMTEELSAGIGLPPLLPTISPPAPPAGRQPEVLLPVPVGVSVPHPQPSLQTDLSLSTPWEPQVLPLHHRECPCAHWPRCTSVEQCHALTHVASTEELPSERCRHGACRVRPDFPVEITIALFTSYTQGEETPALLAQMS